MSRPKKPPAPPQPPDRITLTVAAGGKAALEKRAGPVRLTEFLRGVIADALGMPELGPVRAPGQPAKPG